MSRRSELEHEVFLAEKRLKEAPADTPKDVLDYWRTEYDSLAFQLNNLVDTKEEDEND